MIDFLHANRPYVIAEVGGNHGGDFETAIEYVDAAADAGADAVKFQIYRAERLIQADEPPLPLAGDDYDTQYERFRELEFTTEEWQKLISTVDDRDLDFAASAFDTQLLEFTAEKSPFIKIASGDLTNIPLLRRARELDQPVVLSTGFATIKEIERAVSELGTDNLVLLHCVGSYPTDEQDANLQMINRLAERFNVPVGYSDHTIGTLVPTAAMAMGARVVEKHFTLDKSLKVGDHRLSATPEEMALLVDRANRLPKMWTDQGREEAFQCEREIRENMRRSLATRNEIAAGSQIRENDLIALRPERGISPLRYDEVVDSRSTRDLDAGILLEESDFE